MTVRSIKYTIMHIAASALAAATLFSLSACGKKYDLPESTEDELRAVYVMGEHEVPYEQFRYFLLNYAEEYEDVEYDKLKEMTRGALLRIYATLDLAAEHGIDYKSGDVRKQVEKTLENSIENDFGGVDNFVSGLGPAHMNASVYRFILSEFECEGRLYDKLCEDGVIKTDDDAVIDAISNGEFCCAKQVLIMNDPGDDPEENRKLAENVLMQAQLGADFDTLIAENGEDMDMITKPKGYVFPRGQLIEEFENAAFDLEIGELSDIVESPLGYHIILRCELDPSYVEEHFDELAEAYKASKFYELVSKRVSELTVTETDYLKSLSAADIK